MKFLAFAILVFAGAVVYAVIQIGPQIAGAESQIAKAEEQIAAAESDIHGIEGDMDKITTALAPLTAVGQLFQELQKKGLILDPAKSLPDLNKITADLQKFSDTINKVAPQLASLPAQLSGIPFNCSRPGNGGGGGIQAPLPGGRTVTVPTPTDPIPRIH